MNSNRNLYTDGTAASTAGNDMKDYEWKQRVKGNWRLRYINRLISLGYEKKDAIETYNAMDDIDYNIEPESSAEDEYSYWD